ncbi:MAG: metallophosphoesterase [candidate division Zixibacteria bacterium]|nr:metallophosphoesterase [candidate division Zixibacteria bacterium]
MRRYMKAVRAALLIGLAIWVIGPSISRADEATAVRFAVIGDRTEVHVAGVYEQILAEAGRLRPELMITVGDHIEGYTEDTTELNAEWREYKTLIADIKVPFHLTPGNHDRLNAVERRIFDREIGPAWYSFDYRTIHFIVLDNTIWEKSADLPDEELKWLAGDLQKNRDAATTLVFMHKPFWYASTALGKPDTLHTLFKAFGVDGVFTGHFHEYFSGTFDGIKYTSVGSSGGEVEPGPSGLQYHFCWVTVDGSEMTIAPIRLGSVLPWDEVSVQQELLVEKMKNMGLVCGKVPLDQNLSAVDQPFTVTVHNYSAQTMRDTLRLNSVANWTIRPSFQVVDIPPEGTASFAFTASCAGNMYPVPKVMIGFPLTSGKSIPIETPLLFARQAVCMKAATKPEIDGDLDEAVWSAPATTLFDSDGEPAKTDPVEFYFAYDKNYLYLAARCYDRAIDSLRTTITEHDGTVSSEDCIGFFLQPDTAKAVAYQIYFNTIGTSSDQKLTPGEDGWYSGDRKWNGTYHVKTSRGEGYWTVEAAVPLKQFGVIGKPGATWGLNFRRKQPRYDVAGEWQAPLDYNPASFGWMMMR